MGLVEKLKKRVGQRIRIEMHTETRTEALGNMSPHTDPSVSDIDYSVILHGIYGLNNKPIYVLGKDTNDGKDKLYRSNSDLTIDEDTKCPNYESTVDIVSLDGIDVKNWLSGYAYVSEATEIEKRMNGVETGDLGNLAQALLKGMLHYRLGFWDPSHSVIDDPKFVSRVLKFFDRIV